MATLKVRSKYGPCENKQLGWKFEKADSVIEDDAEKVLATVTAFPHKFELVPSTAPEQPTKKEDK